jgi:hypothetical protein
MFARGDREDLPEGLQGTFMYKLSVHRCDGNDVGALVRALEAVPFRPGKPSLVLAKTRKGRGVSFMENVTKWHPGCPTTMSLAGPWPNWRQRKPLLHDGTRAGKFRGLRGDAFGAGAPGF